MTTTRSYAHVGCATVILGGASVVLAGGGFEAIGQGYPLGWLGVAAGIALLALLGFLYWISYRSYERQDWIQRQPYSHFAQQSLKRGGFWKGFLVTWTAVLGLHLLAVTGMGFGGSSHSAEQVRAVASLATLALVPAHVVLPLLGGVVWSLVRSTSVPSR